MTMTDPIADLLTRIRNANQAGLRKVVCPASKVKVKILELLEREGFIQGFKALKVEDRDVLTVSLKYQEGNEPVITGLKRISRPGLRHYVRKDKIPRIRNGMGCALISTSQGIMTDREARKAGLGGELLCSIW